MSDFLEERLPLNVRMGASYADEFAVEITQTRGGSEHRRLVHPYPVRHFTVQYALSHAELWSKVIAMYFRAYGMYAGFRVRCMDDFSTNANTGTPTPFDEPMALVSTGVYQLQNVYGSGGTPLAIGLPVRTLFKPVAGTVRVGVSSVEIPAVGWTVDTTNGKVTFAANKTATITGISKAAQAVVSCSGTPFAIGDAVYFSGVAGMTQINGQRALVTAVTAGVSFTVAINSTAYGTWTSGGVANTRPQTGEGVTAGCQFDLPCRFNSRIDISHVSVDYREAGAIDIIELVTP